MAGTYTLPSDSGWQGSEYLALRVHVVQTYDAQQNKSTLTVKLQGRLPTVRTYNDTFTLSGRNGADRTFKVNGSTVATFPGTGSSGYTVEVNVDQQWRDVQYNGSAWSQTVTVNHNSDGSASVPFALDVYAQAQVGGSGYNVDFSGKTATLTLSETPASSGGTVWIYDGGWKECKPYVYDGGWKECEAYIYSNGWVKTT